MLSRKFDPNLVFASLVKSWYVIALFMVLGGFIGVGIAGLKPPLYEANASLNVAVGRDRSVIPNNITIYKADDRVRALLVSGETLEAVIERINQNDKYASLMLSPHTLRSRLKISQNNVSFDLYAYDSDPELAAGIANAWATEGLAALEEAYVHAIRAAELQDAIYEANCSLVLREIASENRAVWFCQTDEISTNSGELPEALLEEVRASKGILPIYSFTLGYEADVPTDPIRWGRSGMILASMLLGLIIGLFAALTFLDDSKREAGMP